MTQNENHPSAEQLTAFSLGQLPPQDAVEVESHISECQPCCETLLGLSSDDTFVELLKDTRRVDDGITIDCSAAEEDTAGAVGVPAVLTEHPRYRVVNLIAKGGMGDVFKAEHRMMERTVALKVIRQELMRKPEAVERFHREVKTVAKLSHPNIVTSHDAEQAGDVHFLVMEYVDGVDLARKVKDQVRLSVSEACDCIRQAAEGLQYAHEQGMVHRDIKPHNLMITPNGTVKILDFGLASLAVESLTTDEDVPPQRSELTAAGAIMGTPDYISPEQAQDAHQADIRSDIYSLGATLYYLLSGQAPFGEESVMHKLKSHAELEPEPIRNVQMDVPPEVAEVIRRMMAKDPAERFQTPAEVADVLAPLVDRYRRSSETPPRPEPQAAAARAFSFGGMWPKVALAACGVLLVGTIFFVTDNGTLVIESEDESIEVAIRSVKQGSYDTNRTSETVEYRITDTVTGSTVKQLRSGAYSVQLKGDQNEFTVSPKRFVLSRGDKVVVKVTRRPRKIASLADVAKDEMRRKVRRLVNAARQSSTDEEWDEVVAKHAPLLNLKETPDGENAPFGEEEMRHMRRAGRTLIELLAGLPDESLDALGEAGYLKWRFKQLDERRRTAMQNALAGIFSAAGKLGFPSGLEKRAPEMLDRGDVGYAIVKTSSGEALLWYFSMPEAPIPMLFPILGDRRDDEPPVYSKSVYKQLAELEDRLYSDVPDALQTTSITEVRRFRGPSRYIYRLPEGASSKSESGERSPKLQILERWAGTWRVELREQPTPAFARAVTMKHTSYDQWILDDRYLIAHTMSESEGEQFLTLTTFDQWQNLYRNWLFTSTGLVVERTGKWDAAANELAWETKPLFPGMKGSFTDRFVDADRRETKLLVQNADGQVTRYVLGTAQRNNENASHQVPTSNGPLAEIPQLASLVGLAGNWSLNSTFRSSVAEPEGNQEATRETVRWILGGRFLFGQSCRADDRMIAVWLMTYDPKESTYWYWVFHANGSVGKWGVSLEPDTRTFHYRAVELPEGWIGTGFHRWIADGRLDKSVVIKDGDGRVLMEMTQQQERIE